MDLINHPNIEIYQIRKWICVRLFNYIERIFLRNSQLYHEFILAKRKGFAHIFLVGNKLDLKGQRQVSIEEGKHLASRLNCGHTVQRNCLLL